MKTTLIISIVFSTLFSKNTFTQNNCISYSGDESYYRITPNQTMNFSNNFTIEAWVNPRIKLGSYTILSKTNCGEAKTSFALLLVDGHVQWTFNESGNCNNSSYIKTDDVVVQPGICTHVAVVHSDEGIEIYINGEWVSHTIMGSSYSDIYISSEPILIGIYKNLLGNMVFPFVGTIDEIRIWDIVRTESELALNYNNELINYDPNLLVYYNFNSTSINGNIMLNQVNSGTSMNANYISTLDPDFELSCVEFYSGIEEFEKDKMVEDISIFPNPFSNSFTVDLKNNNSSIKITILDVLGKELLCTSTTESSIQIDSSNFPKGCYFLDVTDIQNNHVLKKIIRQ